MAKKIGLIGAMDEELALLLKQVEDQQKQIYADSEFITGTYFGHNVVVCKSGIGKVNAAINTQILIDRFGVENVIFTGVAGAAEPSLNIGDIVISSSCQQHDMDASALGYKVGVTPDQEVSDFPADLTLIKLAEESCLQLGEDCHYIVGRVLSGDQFISDKGIVSKLHDNLGGVCVEMEGAAVAQVCHRNKIPYVVIRSMSDKADNSAHMNYPEFVVIAADRSFEIIQGIFKQL
jgi:adenosylhomocysteine nucleosidase